MTITLTNAIALLLAGIAIPFAINAAGAIALIIVALVRL